MASATAQTRRSPNGEGDLSWKRFLDGGSEGISEVVVLAGGHRVKLSWADGHESDFSLKWLRDHSDGSFEVTTKQRKVDTFAISNDVRINHVSVEPMSVSPSYDADAKIDTDKGPQQVLRLRWDADGNNSSDEEECTVSIARLRQHCSSELARTLRRQLGTLTGVEKPDPIPVLWGKGVLSSTAGSNPARYEYKAIMEDDQQSSPASSSSSSSQTAACQLRGRLKSHGIALVRGVPTNPAATEALGQNVAGHLMGTVFGKTVWGLSPENHDSDAFFRDSSYSTDALPMHTDYPYGSETPGLLVFSCLLPAPEGGESTYVDGFAVAERLRKENPEAFEFFTKTPITYQYVDDENHLVADGPIFKTDPLGAVVQVRFHDEYRAPLDYLSTDDIDRFYAYHKSLVAITRDPSMVEHILLEKGDTMIFNNHRALHARGSYKGMRRMVGAYIGKDSAYSQARMKGFYV